MDKKILSLQQKFKEIKEQGYVKSIRKGSTGIGATFEYLIGKIEESFEIPDFNGIEIKTRREYSKSHITLFNAVPTGSSFYEVKRLRDNYGYRDPKDHNLKRLSTIISGDIIIRCGLWYYFKLEVDREKERINLNIYDHKKNLIDNNTYWDFDILKEKIYRKLQVLAIIKAWTNQKNGIKYFKYDKMTIYIFKDFDYFIKAVEDGYIKVKLAIGNYYDEKRYGMVHSHGVGFCIGEENLLKIYDIYR